MSKPSSHLVPEINEWALLKGRQDLTSKIMNNKNQSRRYFFLSDYYQSGGCVTFTAHLLRSLGKKWVFLIRDGYLEGDQSRSTQLFRKREGRDFGYGVSYKIQPKEILEESNRPFITDCFHYSHILGPELKRVGVKFDSIYSPSKI
jgi:hypothetical protein